MQIWSHLQDASCVLKYEAPSSISSSGFSCLWTWSCLLLPLDSSLSSSPYTAVRASSPDTAFILALPRALLDLCPTNPAFLALAVALLILTHCVQFVNLFLFSWPQFGLLFLILTVYPPKHLECPVFTSLFLNLFSLSRKLYKKFTLF